MIAILIFVVIYIISVYACNAMDDLAEVEDNTLLNYIPVLNTFLLLLCIVVALIWVIVETIRYGGK